MEPQRHHLKRRYERDASPGENATRDSDLGRLQPAMLDREMASSDELDAGHESG